MGALHIEIPPSTKMLAPCRALATAWLRSHDRDDDRLPLVVTELLTNAIDAAKRIDNDTDAAKRIDNDTDAAPDQIAMTLHRIEDRVLVSVTNLRIDTEPSFVAEPMPDRTSVRGRGLAIVERLCDELEIASDHARVDVSCSLTLGPDSDTGDDRPTNPTIRKEQHT